MATDKRETALKFNLAKKALFERKIAQANKYFQECFASDKAYITKTFKLLYATLDNHNSYRMEYLLEILKNVPDDESRKDYNLIVYLLKYTDCLTAKGRSLAKDIHYEDIKLNENDSRYENIAIQNKIRYLIYKNNFSQALGEMDRHIKKEDITPLESFVRNCLIKIIHCLQVREIKIYQCIVSKNYEELEKYLYFLYRNGIAVYYYSYILKISRKIREITETGVVPLEKEADYQTIYDAINNEDYPKALAMFEKFKPDENQKCNGLIKMLLIDITNLINDLNEGREEKRVRKI